MDNPLPFVMLMQVLSVWLLSPQVVFQPNLPASRPRQKGQKLVRKPSPPHRGFSRQQHQISWHWRQNSEMPEEAFAERNSCARRGARGSLPPRQGAWRRAAGELPPSSRDPSDQGLLPGNSEWQAPQQLNNHPRRRCVFGMEMGNMLIIPARLVCCVFVTHQHASGDGLLRLCQGRTWPQPVAHFLPWSPGKGVEWRAPVTPSACQGVCPLPVGPPVLCTHHNCTEGSPGDISADYQSSANSDKYRSACTSRQHIWAVSSPGLGQDNSHCGSINEF